MRTHLLIGIGFGLLTALSGCQTVDDEVLITSIAVTDLPASVSAAILEQRPDFAAEEVQQKIRSGRTYYDVEGLASDKEIEFDILMTDNGPVIVETQRDLTWSSVPEDVREIYARETGAAEPVRIIESIQTDGAIIYEMFVEGVPDDPSYEIRVTEGGPPELLSGRWEH